MEMNVQLHAPTALSSGKESPVETGQEAGWSPQPFWKQWRKRKDFLTRTQCQF